LFLENVIPAQCAAVALVLLAAPLFLDLGIAILGNLRRARPASAAVQRSIRLAVVIPAHDEEPVIARTVRSLMAAGCAAHHPGAASEIDPENWEAPVFVVAHNCSDATAAIAEAAGARVLVLGNPRLRGKGAALRCGFQAAQAAGANAFLVIDADSIASPNLLAATGRALAGGAEATQCRYELEKPAGGRCTGLARLRLMAFRGINVLRARGRARLGFSAGIFGNGFAVTAQTLDRVPFTPDSICEDLEYHIKLVCAGVRVRWVEEGAVWAPLSAPGFAQATQEARWEGGRFHVATRAVVPLVKAALGGNWSAWGTLLEACSLPLSRGLVALLLTVLLPLQWLHVFALVCLAIACLYALESALLGDEPGRDLAALAVAPAHIAWKLLITPLVLRQTRKRAEWARTRREVQQR
jgi:cellulose synthase/poly-beta-1,6-N-acetylglucosamine synthase-like glycosyltransferase